MCRCQDRFCFPWRWQPVFTYMHMTRPEGQTQVIAHDQSISLSFAVCLGLLSANLQNHCTNQQGYTLLSLLKFRTNAQSVKWEGRNLMEKKTWKYCGWHGCWIALRFCSSIARYCDTVVITTALIPWASNTIVSSSSCKSRECKRPLKNRQIRA